MMVNDNMISTAKVERPIVGVTPQARPKIREPKLGMRNSAREIVPIIRRRLGMELRFSAGSSNFRLW